MNQASNLYLRAPRRHPPFLNWYLEGLRGAVLLTPRWKQVQAGPAAVALLTLIAVLLSIGIEALYVSDAARFNWRALGSGWFTIALTAWVCYLVRPDHGYDPNPRVAPSAAHLYCQIVAQTQIVTLVTSLLYLLVLRAGYYNQQTLGAYGAWALWLLPLIWALGAELKVILACGIRRRGPRVFAVFALVAGTLIYVWIPPAGYWIEARRTTSEDARPELALTQELMESQPALLAERLNDLAPQRPGIIDVYAITFAPFADEDVFMRESAMVSDVMQQRFDAAGRSIQLVNNVNTVDEWPWATRANLERTLRHVAGLMDPKEDILFIHLTSHGARDGQLAADFWPMAVEPVTPADLKSWLDEAGVRYRILSISACYSGSWIPSLRDASSLIVTAADADHTSYGCGRGSELTFFGRAMYDEQLRAHTRSFETAHATARELIKQREEEAGKSDGYSNPQLDMGTEIRARLEALRTRLEP